MAPDRSNAPDDAERIVDLVFAGEPGGRVRRLAAGAAAVLAIYVAAVLIAGAVGGSGATFAAELAAQIHDAIAAERSVDIKLPPPPPPPPAPETPAPSAPQPVAHARAHAPAHHAPAAPAQAGQIAAATPAPLDFTGSAFVVGSGPTYAGGTTTAQGTSRAPVTGAVAPNGHGDGVARSKARPVSIDQASWNCPWPAEADARQVDQETVVLRVAVRADGRVDRVDVLQDPGFGFGRAARDCALGSRAFTPALDPSGAPVAAMSPPIRVHFYR
jgi:protein TonB